MQGFLPKSNYPCSRPAEIDIAHWLKVDYPGLAQLLGYTVTPESAVPGEEINVTLFWQVTSTTERDYVVFVQLLWGDDERAGNRDTHPGLGRYPTSRWEPGEVVRAQFDMFVPHDAGPGDYSVSLNLVDESGASGEDTFMLAPVAVTGAE